MNITIKIKKTWLPGDNFLRYFLLTCLLGVTLFCAWYLLSGYDHLVGWFTGLNNCFYRNATWAQDFFTPHVKAAGNLYCITALLLLVAGIIYILRYKKGQSHRDRGTLLIQLNRFDLIAASICLVIATASWWWGNSLVNPSNDEVFSAVNCASIHPFQAMAYYMLPNNHIFFNLLNNLFFHFCADKVASGRIISLACYWALIVILYHWLKSLIQNRWLIVLAVLTMSVQFPIWGFSFQARGYELLTLTEWVAFISYFQYAKSNDIKWMYFFITACAAGYFCIPSFLYFHAAILLFACFRQLSSRKPDWRFWKYQFIGMAIVYLLYLPCLCFSGFSAVAGNPWVTSGQTFHQLIADARPMLDNYMDYCFFSFIDNEHIIDYLLFIAPVSLLFFRKNNTAISMGWFYVSLWGVCILLTVVMKIYPIDRALCGQFSVTVGLVIYTIYLSVVRLSQKIKINSLPIYIMTLFLVLLTANYLKKDKIHAPHYLCHFQVNSWYDMVNDGINTIPPGSSVSFSDESFYWYYLCTKRGYQTSKCVTGNEPYFIRLHAEPFPTGAENTYDTIKTVGDYSIYKRK